jgi:hypothetical protein
MEGAAGLEFTTGSLERYAAFNDLDDIDPGKEFLDERVGNKAAHSGHLFRKSAGF